MSWLTKLLGSKATKSTSPLRKKPAPKPRSQTSGIKGLRVVGRGGYPRSIVGESHCQAALSNICGGHNREGHWLETVADLALEPTNPYDENAVMVTISGEKVGYLSRDDAPKYLEALREAGFDGQRVKVAAKIVGGWRTNQHDAGHFGVKLAMPWPVKFES